MSKLKDQVVTNIGGTNAGTLTYQHIEQLKGHKVTPAVDVYSFGVIAGEIYTRQPAWKGLSSVQVRQQIEEGQYPSFEGIPSLCKKIIGKCFKLASERSTFGELLPYLESLSDVSVW